jgi:symplekin
LPNQLQSKNDPNLNLCPSNHPLIKPAELDKEVNFLIEQMITTFYQQAYVTVCFLEQGVLLTPSRERSDPAILHPIINLIPPVVKSRPQLAGAFLPALASWSPNTMVAAGRPFMQIKAVEKTLKVVMVHLLRSVSTQLSGTAGSVHLPFSSVSRSGQHAAFQPQLTDALNRQAERITAALKEEKAARQSARAAAAAAAPLGQDLKRPAEVMQPESSATAAKRARVRSPSPQRLMGEPAAGVKAEARSAPSGPGSGDCKGVEFDVSTLDVGMANELLMAALIAVDPVTLASACEVS